MASLSPRTFKWLGGAIEDDDFFTPGVRHTATATAIIAAPAPAAAASAALTSLVAALEGLGVSPIPAPAPYTVLIGSVVFVRDDLVGWRSAKADPDLVTFPDLMPDPPKAWMVMDGKTGYYDCVWLAPYVNALGRKRAQVAERFGKAPPRNTFTPIGALARTETRTEVAAALMVAAEVALEFPELVAEIDAVDLANNETA